MDDNTKNDSWHPLDAYSYSITKARTGKQRVSIGRNTTCTQDMKPKLKSLVGRTSHMPANCSLDWIYMFIDQI